MLHEIITFLRNSVRNFHTIGAVLPSSQQLAKKITSRVAIKVSSARILEVGAGTGVFTKHLINLLSPEDHLDICEVNPDFVQYLEKLTKIDNAFQNCKGSYQIHPIPVQEIQGESCYDYIICGLPFNAFPAPLVQEILSVLCQLLKTDGWLSYFEYVGLRRIQLIYSMGQERQRIQLIHQIMSNFIKQYQVERELILANFPPAYVRHCQKKEKSV